MKPNNDGQYPFTATTLILCAIILGLAYVVGKEKGRDAANFSMIAVGTNAVAVLNTATGDVSVLTAGQNGQLVRVYEAGITNRWGDKARFNPDTAKPPP